MTHHPSEDYDAIRAAQSAQAAVIDARRKLRGCHKVRGIPPGKDCWCYIADSGAFHSCPDGWADELKRREAEDAVPDEKPFRLPDMPIPWKRGS